jgi:excisionase family DNA binding protein
MQKQANNQQALLRVKDVARILHVDPTTVRRWVKEGLLEAVPLPHKGKRVGYRFRRETIDAILASTWQSRTTDRDSANNRTAQDQLE